MQGATEFSNDHYEVVNDPNEGRGKNKPYVLVLKATGARQRRFAGLTEAIEQAEVLNNKAENTPPTVEDHLEKLGFDAEKILAEAGAS